MKQPHNDTAGITKGGALMYYCDNCHLVCEGPVCPYCGKAHLRAPEDGDYCYLATMVSPWGEAMQELLTDAQIPCLTRQARSVLYSVAFGQTHAELELFVPFAHLEQAASLQKSLLTSELTEQDTPENPQ